MADILSDVVLDLHLEIDDRRRVACEVMLSKERVFICGEIDNFEQRGTEEKIRQKLSESGYKQRADGLCSEDCEIIFSTSNQSKSLSNAIGDNLAAGDQSIVVGFATKEHSSMLPKITFFGKRLAFDLSRESINEKRPDGKVFVQEALIDGQTKYFVTVSSQHSRSYDDIEFRRGIKTVVDRVFMNELAPNGLKINPPTGKFSNGGPAADVGLTGRKLVAESYGPFVPHGGGALSGKDATKVDRTGAYAARCLAKSIVAAGLIETATVFIGYMIGKKSPVHIEIWDGKRSRPDLSDHVTRNVDLSLGHLIEFFDLRKPQFVSATECHHYGIVQSLPWEAQRFEL